MNLRLELRGWVLYLDWSRPKPEEPQPDEARPPVDTPTPMVVYPDEPRDPLGFHSGR